MQTNKSTENFLKLNLPANYSKLVCAKLGLETSRKNRARIRNVKYGKVNDSEIYLKLLEVAEEEKKRRESINNFLS